MSIAELLNDLRRRDVRIEVHGDRLRFDAPTGTLSAELRDTLRSRKQEILEFLNRANSIARQQPAIVPLNAQGTRQPIYGVPGHSGDVFCYRWLSAQLGKDQPFYGLQPPGLDGTRKPIDNVTELAAYFAQQIRATEPRGPIIIAGFCAGGGIALELACQLREQGQDVSLLAIFASPFPKAYRFWSMVRIRIGNALERIGVHWQRMRAGASGGMLRYGLDRLRAVSEARTRQRSEVEAIQADPLGAARRQLEDTTIRALTAYEPRRFPGPGVFFLPSAKWRRIGDNSGRWATVMGEYSEHVGPEDCTGDNILLEPHVARTAAEFERRRRS